MEDCEKGVGVEWGGGGGVTNERERAGAGEVIVRSKVGRESGDWVLRGRGTDRRGRDDRSCMQEEMKTRTKAKEDSERESQSPPLHYSFRSDSHNSLPDVCFTV